MNGTPIAHQETLAVSRVGGGRERMSSFDHPQILVVDDDPAMREFLRALVASRGYRATVAGSAEDAVARYRSERPTAVLLDIVLPGIDGLDVLATFKRLDKDVPIIVVSGQGRTSTVVQAMKLGATDFVCKPFETEDIERLLAQAVRQRRLQQDVANLREQLQTQSQYGALFGSGEAMREVCQLIDRVADTDATVLIRGESGTGKELVARAIHARSLRKDKPFVKVNCAALPTELLESELFGFEKGAFTGAMQHKPGKFEFANQGTMFLDEIGEMSPPLQAKLLQVVQDGEFSRLGGRFDVQVDVRLVAATNRDLESAVAQRLFREDLYFRLNVVTIHVPPLRERRDEIPLLVDHFLKKYSVQYNRPLGSISAGLQRQLLEYDWPGNVRELENTIKRLIILGTEAPLLKDLQQPSAPPRRPAPTVAFSSTAAAKPQPVPPPPAAAASLPATATAMARAGADSASGVLPAAAGTLSLKAIARTAAREAERELIQRMLTRTCWNRKEAAEILGISYKALLYKIKENGLDKVS
jgi:two-component system, NtrC family, response regulator AtoC